MQKTGSNHTGAGSDIPQKVCNSNGMNDVGVAAGTKLSFVKLKPEIKR